MSRRLPTTTEGWISFAYEHSTPEPNTGCWIWTRTVNGQGYAQARPQLGTRFVHRRVLGLSDPALDACHVVCDQPSCVNPAHLRPGTAQENIRDAQAKGRMKNQPKRGCGYRALTPEQVLAIRQRYREGGETHASLAEQYGVTSVAICALLNRRTWKHLREAA